MVTSADGEASSQVPTAVPVPQAPERTKIDASPCCISRSTEMLSPAPAVNLVIVCGPALAQVPAGPGGAKKFGQALGHEGVSGASVARTKLAQAGCGNPGGMFM